MIDWTHEMTEVNRRNNGTFPMFQTPEEMLCYLYGYLRSITKFGALFQVAYYGTRTALLKSGATLQRRGRVETKYINRRIDNGRIE